MQNQQKDEDESENFAIKVRTEKPQALTNVYIKQNRCKSIKNIDSEPKSFYHAEIT